MSPCFSFLPRNVSLLQYPGEEVAADIGLVRIWDTQSQRPFLHELVISAGVRTLETEHSEIADQVGTFDRTEGRH